MKMELKDALELADKMSLEQATEILESNGVSGTSDDPIYYSASTVSVAARIVIAHHQRREERAVKMIVKMAKCEGCLLAENCGKTKDDCQKNVLVSISDEYAKNMAAFYRDSGAE